MFVQLLVLMLAGMAAGAQERQPGRGLNLYSLEKEAALGAQLAEEVRKTSTVLGNAPVRDYIERLAKQLGVYLAASGFTYRFEVITEATNELNEPLTLPGGYIFIPAGLFLACEDEAEFAGMLAHAMAHVAARHGTRMASRAQVANLSSIPLILPVGSWGTGAAGAKALPAVPLGFLTFSRGFEMEADMLAAQVMARAGYDPAALVRYIRRVQIDRTDRPMAKAFSSLPPRDTRIAELQKLIQQLPAWTYSSTGEYKKVRHEVLSLAGK